MHFHYNYCTTFEKFLKGEIDIKGVDKLSL